MKLVVELLSDLCTYSGETYNSVVDTDVVYDDYGLPYIPAKRLKGCLREACMELVDFNLAEEEIFETLFGKEGNDASAFSISNAYLDNYEAKVNALKSVQNQKMYTPQKVLDLFTYTRVQTAVDLETGTADKNSLRTMRVVKKGLLFEAKVNWNQNKYDKETKEYTALSQAASLIKHIGCGRTRGLGLVEITLDDRDNEQKKECKKESILFDENNIYEKNKISYKITLSSPVICKSPAGNQASTQDYIAGSKVLGLLAGKLGPEVYRDLIKDELIVSNAYILYGSKRTIPGRNSWQKEKNQDYDNNGKMIILDMLCNPDVSNRQMTPANLSYVEENGHVMSVDTEISYHHKRPDDKSIGKAADRDESSFYQMESIRAGQCFGGFILANKQQAQKIIHAISEMQHVRIGYGKNAEFGEVNLQLTANEEVKAEHEMMKEAVVTLTSDLIMYNENGVPSTDSDCLKAYLKEALELQEGEDLQIEKKYISFSTIGGYNTTWKAMKPIIPVLNKGSVFVIQSEKEFDAARLKNTFLGERVSEGYGELRVEKLPKSAEYTVFKMETAEMNAEDPDGKAIVMDEDLLQQLEEKENTRKLEEQIRKCAETVTLKADIMSIAVSRLRAIYNSVETYAELVEQVEQIASNSSKSACKSIIKVLEDKNFICAEGDNSKANKVPYKQIYRIYLTELKYRAKIKKEDEKREAKKNEES